MELVLEKNELVSMGRQLMGCTILCTEGLCWVTQEKNLNDHILSAGKEFLVATNGHLVVTATEACRIKVLMPDRNNNNSWLRKLFPQVSLLRFT